MNITGIIIAAIIVGATDVYKRQVWARVYVSYIIPVVVLYIFVQGYWSKFFA